MRELHLDNNRLRGQIPPELGELSNLTALSLANNQFTGCVSVPLLRVAANDLDSLNLPACSPVQVETESIPFAHNPAEDFDILAGEGRPEGIWSDGTTMWVSVVAQGEEPARIYAYGLVSKQRVPERDFNTLAGAGNDSPEALWSDGTTLWVADSVDGKIYAYDLATTQRVPGRDFESLGDPDHPSLTPRGLWSDGATLWEAESGGHKVFAHSMDSKARIPGQDFNTLGASGNRNPEGIWSDGTTMWVADIGEAALYAYALTSRARTGDRDFRTLAAAGNESPGDIWSDGATMWVVDNADRKIYAYHMPPPAAEETPQPQPEPEPEISPQPELEEMFPDIHPDDLAALRAFYDSVDEDAGLGETWFVPGGSLKSWRGIETRDGRVTALELHHSALKGTLPPELGNLEKLERLNLRFNQLSGRIPQELGNLKNLELLDLAFNNLAGGLPRSLGNLENLKQLNLADNNLGTVLSPDPSDIGMLSRLPGGGKPDHVPFVDLGGLQLVGKIPAELGNLKKLELLDLKDNGLAGEIPVELSGLNRLVTLNLSENDLEGSFQDSGLADLISLQRLELRENELGGTLPREWQQVERVEAAANKLAGIFRIAAVDIRERAQPLVYLDLSNNNLEGPIPTDLGDFKHLRTLNLSHNKLQWHIDFGPGGMESLDRLDLSHNRLSGGLPAGMAAPDALDHMDLSHNELDHNISDVSKFTGLRTLYLDNNKLPDKIPVALEGLTGLQYLTLHNNRFDGCTPFRLRDLLRKHDTYPRWLPGLCETPDRAVLVALYEATNRELDRQGLIDLLFEEFGPENRNLMDDKRIFDDDTDEELLESLNYFFVGCEEDPSHESCSSLTPEFSADIPSKIGWLNSRNWGTSAPLGEWHGVTVEDDRVVELALANNNLVGEIPPELGQLDALTGLYLVNNRLEGEIPPELGQLGRLQVLDLENNNLSGPLPPELGDLKNLQYMILSANYIHGKIPPQLGNLANLTHLDLSYNLLGLDADGQPLENAEDAAIPYELAKLSNLQNLILRENWLVSHIPRDLGNLNLQHVDLHGNFLLGCIPRGLEHTPLLSFSSGLYPTETTVAPEWLHESIEYVAEVEQLILSKTGWLRHLLPSFFGSFVANPYETFLAVGVRIERELKLNDLKEFDLKLPLCPPIPPPPPPPPGNPTETSWETDAWALSSLLKLRTVEPSDFGYNWGQLWSRNESNNEWQFIGKPGDLGKLEGTVLEDLGLEGLEERVTELDLSGLDRTYSFEGAPMPPELANLVY